MSQGKSGFYHFEAVNYGFDRVLPHMERDLTLPKTPKGTTLAPQRPGIRGMSAQICRPLGPIGDNAGPEPGQLRLRQGVAALDRSSSPTILGIQLLRAVAAAAVVIAHVRYDFVQNLSLPESLPAELNSGTAGVDLFFVISGFVMVYSSERFFGRVNAPIAFLARRIARIVPLYWIMTTVMLAYVVARGFAASDASPMLAFASYFFVPYPRPSGVIDPLYGVGWTLNYEMFFYLVFAAALTMRRAAAVAGITVLFVTLAVFNSAAQLLPRQLAYLSDPIILEFVLGMAVALAYRSGVRMPPAIAFLLVAAAIAEFAWYTSAPSTEIPRWIGYGGPAVQTVAAFALIDRTFSFRVVEKLGDASYALYLIHPVIISAARTLAKKGYVDPAGAAWPYLIGITTISVCASLIVYRFIEKPATERCRRTLLNITSYPPRRFVRLDPSRPP